MTYAFSFDKLEAHVLVYRRQTVAYSLKQGPDPLFRKLFRILSKSSQSGNAVLCGSYAIKADNGYILRH